MKGVDILPRLLRMDYVNGTLTLWYYVQKPCFIHRTSRQRTDKREKDDRIRRRDDGKFTFSPTSVQTLFDGDFFYQSSTRLSTERLEVPTCTLETGD